MKHLGNKVKKVTIYQTTEALGGVSVLQVLALWGVQKEIHTEMEKSCKCKVDLEEEEWSQKLQRLDVPEPVSDTSNLSAQNIVDRNTGWMMSHTGGEFLHILLDDPEYTSSSTAPKKQDKRLHSCDRIQNRNMAFKELLPDMTDAYLAWQLDVKILGLQNAVLPYMGDKQGSRCPMDRDNVFCTDNYFPFPTKNHTDSTVQSFIQLGMFPCAPFQPSLAITMCLLKLYSCTYWLEGEEDLMFKMLITMDGNNSLNDELSKYPLTIVEKLLDVFGSGISCGYNIGCKFGATVGWMSLGEKLSFLPTYIEGMGIEDLEGCSFLVSNYYQALEIISEEPALWKEMEDKNIKSTQVFHDWLKQEADYLCGLVKKPEEETMMLDYYQKLVNLHQKELDDIENGWRIVVNDPTNSQVTKEDKKIQGWHHCALNSQDKAQAAVNFLEETIPITKPWTKEMDEYKEAAALASRIRYQHAIDNLEALIMLRLFELSKMNMLHTDEVISLNNIPFNHC
ncbi:hypothetical protein NP233_g10531 [Leucocoprinus birnbaumii]|uniref:Uncharacterized protein n=1 Tax=Leucocoprinus birnbaumii TaxID=56174 RepID=A0AAD5VIK3_9AGAR|nr:hypothetical protein NP233_g10531 [Leucocoprinus birnbaumii]